MHDRAISSPSSEEADRAIFSAHDVSIPLSALRQWAEGWLLECDLARHSEQTLNLRRTILSKLSC